MTEREIILSAFKKGFGSENNCVGLHTSRRTFVSSTVALVAGSQGSGLVAGQNDEQLDELGYGEDGFGEGGFSESKARESEDTVEPAPENPTLADYTDESGAVTDSSMDGAIGHWQRGEVEAELILEIINAWREARE